ncbi:hypothetical protein HELRODRAFT_82734 [Helobdella robusta]|uniref:SH3 domain-containing protein n=1 Tax=Helobdella robusta TaxID=6412 RepID=T1G4V8_HELRO|nr:hypothetical protein HELRODRAFT_82734 [Helobdella robusta]ESO00654.1 hypothetical protein HELRODRAFT_82734 [Helobdella robusta]
MSTHSHHSDGSDGGSSHFPPGFTDIEFYLDESDATHRGCHKFLPRHDEEIAVEIGDNLYIEKEHDDLWCEGINLRTKKRGIFPTAYATDLSLMGDAPKVKYFVSFLGSIEIGQHNGHDILCKAIKKVRTDEQKDAPLNLSCLEIDENGVKVSERKKLSLLKNLQENEHVFLLKNITFCGILPSNDKYMGFITKHPVCMKFACHVFLASNSARPIVEAIGGALSRFHQEFLTVVYPVEDIYFE